MQYFDKNGKEIRAGMKILMEDGSIEMVYDTEDQYGNPNLGINASNEEFLKLHPNWAREYYSLSMFKQSGIEVCPSEQEIRTELEELAPIIEGTELALDYLYGEEETHRATPEEVAYFMKRIEMDDTFLSRCDNIESVDFTINWSPVELFNM